MLRNWREAINPNGFNASNFWYVEMPLAFLVHKIQGILLYLTKSKILEVGKMPKMTVSVPDDVLKRFKETCPDVNPAEVVRRGIIRKIKELEKLEELKSKGVI